MRQNVKAPKKFSRDQRGNVAPVFGLMAIPMLAITGAAVDFGKAISLKADLQNVIDAAAVSSAQEYAATGETAAAETRLRNFIKAEIENKGLELNAPPADPTLGVPEPEGNEVAVIEPGISTVNNSVTPVVKSNVPTAILKLIGISEIPIEVSSTAQLSGKKLELSLMLDVTGSMDWNAGGVKKIVSMKEAANDLLDIFSTNMAAGATRIALVPFSESVNVGETLAGQVRAYPSRTKRFRKRSNNRRTTYQLTTCVTERNGNHRFTDDPPGPGRYLGPMYSSNGYCKPSQELIPLTSNESNLRTIINGLQPSGGTAGHIGTAWAWYLINDRWAHLYAEPSKPELPNTDELIKATILMTDGDYNVEYCQGVNDSTINCNSPNGTSQAQATALCEAMKNDGIVVYSVGFGISQNSSQETLLKNCASDNTKYFFPYNGQQLRAAFSEIGRQLHAGQAGVQLTQ